MSTKRLRWVLAYPQTTVPLEDCYNAFNTAFRDVTLLGVRRYAMADEYFVKFPVRKLRKTVFNQFGTLEFPLVSVYSTTKSQFTESGVHWPPVKKPLATSTLDLLQDRISLQQFVRQQPNKMPYLGNYQYALHRLRPPQLITTQIKKRGVLLWGNADQGKSTIAMGIIGNRPFYDKDHSTATYDGYQGQRIALMDDATPQSPALKTIRTALNIKSAPVNVKNSIAYVFFDFFIITSQFSLKQLFPRPADYQMALARLYQVQVVNFVANLDPIKAIMPV